MVEAVRICCLEGQAVFLPGCSSNGSLPRAPSGLHCASTVRGFYCWSMLRDFPPLGGCKRMARRTDVEGNFLSVGKSPCKWHQSPSWESLTSFLCLKQSQHMQIKLVIHQQSSSFQIPNRGMLIKNSGMFLILGGALRRTSAAHRIPANRLLLW